jgi:hypothetical protein
LSILEKVYVLFIIIAEGILSVRQSSDNVWSIRINKFNRTANFIL